MEDKGLWGVTEVKSEQAVYYKLYRISRGVTSEHFEETWGIWAWVTWECGEGAKIKEQIVGRFDRYELLKGKLE